MATEIKLKIPDLWFDFYARLIPGTIFIATLRLWSLGITTIPNTNEIFLLIGAAYFTGLVTQPLASRIAKLIEKRVNPERKNPAGDKKKWLRILQYKLGRESRDSLILSKMHGEVTFFVQLAIMTLLFWFQNFFKFLPYFNYSEFNIFWLWYIIFFTLALIGAFEVADRRVKRAKDIEYFISKDIINNNVLDKINEADAQE